MEKTMSPTRFAMPTKVFVGASTLFILSILYLMIQESVSQRNQDFSEAITSGDQHTVHQLIADGFDPKIAMVDYYNPDIFQRLSNLISKSKTATTPIEYTLESLDRERMKRFLSSRTSSLKRTAKTLNGAVLNEVYSESSWQFSLGKRVAILKELVEHGCLLKKTTLPGDRTPIQFASLAGNAEAIESLLQHGAKLDAADSGGAIALEWGCQSGDLDTVKTLLNAGAQVNFISYGGKTALMQAVQSGIEHPKDVRFLSIIQFLIDRGWDVDYKDNLKNSSLSWATQSFQKEATPGAKAIVEALTKASHLPK